MPQLNSQRMHILPKDMIKTYCGVYLTELTAKEETFIYIKIKFLYTSNDLNIL